MADYISREDLRAALEASLARNNHQTPRGRAVHDQEHRHLLRLVESIPAAEVAPVIRARWEWGHVCGQAGYYCTNCRAGWTSSPIAEELAAKHKYCPECGAKMDPYPPKKEDWGECLGYTCRPCPNCGRYRVERYSNAKEICEKCRWCPQEERYVEREEVYPPDHHWEEG